VAGSSAPAGPTASATGVDRRQLATVGLCLVGLFLASILAPPAVSSPDPSTPEGQPTPSEPPDDGGSGSPNVVGDGGEPVAIPGNDTFSNEDGCVVVLGSGPRPGETVAVRVWNDRRPVPDVPVRFNGDPVGRTNETGVVTAAVPYNRTLSVSVELAGVENCEFVRPNEQALREPGVGKVHEAREANEGASVLAVVESAIDGPPTGDVARQATPSGNLTGTYEVYGEANVSVVGEPYPGEAVTVVAHVAGVAMTDASVTVGGESVATTDGAGRAEVTVPDRDEVAVGVSRGDFAGSATVDVLVLAASVVPAEGFPFPGERVRVRVTSDDDPVGSVPVSVGGQRVGATGPDGTVSTALPLDPLAAVTARTDRQTARVGPWLVYGPTLAGTAVLGALAAVSTAVVSKRRGRDAARTATEGWLGAFVLFAGLVVGELPGVLLAAVGVLAAGLYRYRDTAGPRGREGADALAGMAQTARTTALSLADRLARGSEWVARLRARLAAAVSGRSLRERVRSLAAALRRAAAGWVSVQRGVAAVGAVVGVALATVQWHLAGFVASVLGVVLLASLVVLWRRGDPTDDSPDEDHVPTAGRTTGTGGVDRERVSSVRGLWRRFARRVTPGRWRTSTPGEVGRAAIERGLPREPVETLTQAFREVEYGAAPAQKRRESAREAFERLRAADSEEEER